MTRVRKRTFLVVTLLIPVFFAAMIIIPVSLAVSADDKTEVAVVDESGLFASHLSDAKDIYFKDVSGVGIDTFRAHYAEHGYGGLLYIPKIDINRPAGITYYSNGSPGISLERTLTDRVNELIEEARMRQASMDIESIHRLHSDIDINFKSGDDKQGNSYVSYAVGYASGFIIYLILMIFGMSVMRGVMEEKVSRIAEVMISSVKPFQLMMGKIIGIAAVGLLQFFIWAFLITILQFLLPVFLSHESIQALSQSSQGVQSPGNAAMVEALEKVQYVIGSINWTLIISCFVFYFLGGYLFYSALFAAVGSLVNEDPTDVQSLTFPITLPVIIGIMITITAVHHPDSPVAVWGSIIPFTSPMVMMARLPYGVPGTVPVWQLVLSMVLLVLGFLFTTWMAGKIYRTGILLYGKKVTWKEALKWVTR